MKLSHWLWYASFQYLLDYWIMDTHTAAQLFDVLSSPVRLEIYRQLVKAGRDGRVAGELSSALDIAPSNLSFHLKALSHADMVSARAEGRFLRYRANLGQMLNLVDFLSESCCEGHADYCTTLRAQSRCQPMLQLVES